MHVQLVIASFPIFHLMRAPEMEIIITDLTRFRKPDKFCTAGVTWDGTVVRPMPYLLSERCRELNIHPGGILAGDFRPAPSDVPHIEDAWYTRSKLRFKGRCSSETFRKALEATLYDSVSDGFEYAVRGGEKCIPITASPPRSLITVKVNPRQLTIQRDAYHADKLKANFSDASGTELRFVSITDRGFFDYAREHAKRAGDVAAVNDFIHSQSELYLRLGLGRRWRSGDRDGFWIQLNGIYTFPEYQKCIRSYD